MNKVLKSDYKRSINILRGILNRIDPEGLRPGENNGAPIDEYDDEIARIYNFVRHNLEKIKLNKYLLIDEIGKIWIDSFGKDCNYSDEIANQITKELF